MRAGLAGSAAVAATIDNKGPALLHRPGQVRRLAVVLDVANAGASVTAVMTIERVAPVTREN